MPFLLWRARRRSRPAWLAPSPRMSWGCDEHENGRSWALIPSTSRVTHLDATEMILNFKRVFQQKMVLGWMVSEIMRNLDIRHIPPI